MTPQINHRIVIGNCGYNGPMNRATDPLLGDDGVPNIQTKILSVATLTLVSGFPVAAQGVATPWIDGYNSKTRLLAATFSPPKPIVNAGIEISMASGWKTYWRNPGDAGGVPPTLDWAASSNVASVKMLFPAPSRLKDASGDSIGYKSSVVFPLEITPKDATKPIDLKLAIEFGVCREICVPAEAKLSLSIPATGNVGTNRAALRSTAGNPVLTTAAAILGVSIRAMIPSPFQPSSHAGGSSPRPCSIR